MFYLSEFRIVFVRWWLMSLPFSLWDITQEFILFISITAYNSSHLLNSNQWFLCSIIAPSTWDLLFIGIFNNIHCHCLPIKFLKICANSVLVPGPFIYSVVLESWHPTLLLYCLIYEAPILLLFKDICQWFLKSWPYRYFILVNTKFMLLQSRVYNVLNWYALSFTQTCVSSSIFHP